MKTIVSMLSIISLAASGCGGTAIGNGNNSKNPTGTAPVVVEDPDKVDKPEQINGASLLCTILSEARENLGIAYLGCRFVDDSKNKVDLATLGTAVDFTVTSTEVTGVTVTLKAQTYSNRAYESLVEVRGTDATVVNGFASKLEVSAAVKKLDGTTKSVASGTPAAIVSSSDGYALSTWTVGDVGGSKFAVDSQTGLKWKPFDNDDRVWDVAYKYCDELNYAGITNWRLPLIGEHYLAAVHGIWATSTREQLSFMNLEHPFWSGIPAEEKVDSDGIQRSNLYEFGKALNQVVEKHDIGSRQATVCVSE